MIKSITSLTNSGLRDWLVQRVSAVIIAAYVIYWVIIGLFWYDISYDSWSEQFGLPWVRYFTVVFLFSLIAHAWVGMWTIYTDYIKCSILRLIMQVSTIIAMCSFMIWGFFILWGMI